MAHFAEIDENNIVTRVIVVNNNELLDENNQENEQKGIDFCKSLFGGNWVQTSYNGSFRVRFAGLGFRYDSYHDAFIPPQPYQSWLFSDNTFDWKAPVEYPDDGKYYMWDESVVNWVEYQYENAS
jgi:hypothetical protein